MGKPRPVILLVLLVVIGPVIALDHACRKHESSVLDELKTASLEDARAFQRRCQGGDWIDASTEGYLHLKCLRTEEDP